jgi:hypothetical protein
MLDSSRFCNVRGIAVKHFIFRNKEKELLLIYDDRKRWLQLHNVMVLLKKHMESGLLRGLKYEEFEKNVYIYTKLRDEEPYEGIIEAFTKKRMTKYSINVSKGEKKGIRHSDQSFYLAYYYAHMQLYKTFFTEDKRKIKFEDY